MLETLQVKNLGCLDENVNPISFSGETVLIGPNNSGKSTLISGLNLLRNSFLTHSVRFNTSLYNFWNWEEAVHNHQKEKTIEVTATVDGINYVLYIKNASISKINSSLGDWASDENKAIMRKIWYLHPNRSLIPHDSQVGMGIDSLQPQLSPSGSDVIQFLLEKYTERHPNWDIAEDWFKKFDDDISSIRTPIRSNRSFFEFMISKLPINASLQGSGSQSIASIIAAVVFSPKGSTLIIEEPEICLHKKSQETIVDLFNDAVNNQGKQIIFTTHSWDMLLPFISDVGRGTKRGKQHVHADPAKVKLLAFNKVNGHVTVEPIDLSAMKVSDVKNYLKKLWG